MDTYLATLDHQVWWQMLSSQLQVSVHRLAIVWISSIIYGQIVSVLKTKRGQTVSVCKTERGQKTKTNLLLLCLRYLLWCCSALSYHIISYHYILISCYSYLILIFVLVLLLLFLSLLSLLLIPHILLISFFFFLLPLLLRIVVVFVSLTVAVLIVVIIIIVIVLDWWMLPLRRCSSNYNKILMKYQKHVDDTMYVQCNKRFSQHNKWISHARCNYIHTCWSFPFSFLLHPEHFFLLLFPFPLPFEEQSLMMRTEFAKSKGASKK